MGPLQGIRVLEFAGIGPGPFCAMLLADMGADVVRIDRASSSAQQRPAAAGRGGAPADPLLRGRRSLGVDLKQPEAIEAVLRLVAGAARPVQGVRPRGVGRLRPWPPPRLARDPD